MTVLTLDLGTNTGWAYLDVDNQVTHGVEVFKDPRMNNWRIKNAETHGARFYKFQCWLQQMMTRNIDVIVYEEMNFTTNCSAAYFYGGLRGILLATAYQHNISIHGINVVIIKKLMTGKGRATKQEIIAAVKKLGYEPEDDNAADALAILYSVVKNKDILIKH